MGTILVPSTPTLLAGVALGDAVATSGTWSNDGNDLSVTIDGTVVTTTTSPAASLTWALLDPRGATIDALIANYMWATIGALPTGAGFALWVGTDDPAIGSATKIFWGGARNNAGTRQVGSGATSKADAWANAATAARIKSTQRFAPATSGFSVQESGCTGETAAGVYAGYAGLYAGQLDAGTMYFGLTVWSDGTGTATDTITVAPGHASLPNDVPA